ncbi:MAG: type II toxin-antitoxin system YafQ family toxin [Chlamydiae bacterium]|nr:type II toxin-antitoxin system YafQ family toxin [Chlamydiota bacterium]
MLIPVSLRLFERELKKAKKRGLDMSKIKDVMEDLINEKPLEEKHRNHKLKGNFVGYCECHITPDWLLIYKKDSERIYFVRTGTHADLFE